MVPNHARYHLRYTPKKDICDKAYTIIIKSAVFVKGLAEVVQKSDPVRAASPPGSGNAVGLKRFCGAKLQKEGAELQKESGFHVKNIKFWEKVLTRRAKSIKISIQD